MYSINDYIKHTIMFSNSIVVKSLGAAIAINKTVMNLTFTTIPQDKTTWRYFMNISGKKHPTNNDVMVYIIETGKKELLTKEILDKYPVTKKELLNNESYYDDLINEYPKDRLYIHGCLYPVDIKTAIAAPEGTILAYNPKYVEDAEYSLIKELNSFTTNYFKRWYIKEYTIVDELYIAGVLANLFAILPSKIMNIRLSKIMTPEVHSFHMEHFFRSTLDLWEPAQVLTPASRMWLYKNLRYLKNNIGKNSTLNTIIEKIFNANAMGLGSYNIRVNDVAYNLDSRTNDPKKIPISEPIFTRPSNVLSGIKLNNYYAADNNKTIDTDTVINLELNSLKIDKLNNEPTDRDKFIINNAVKDINNTVYDKQDTKIIELSSSKLFKMYGSDIYKVILDHWVYFTQNNVVEYTIEYVDPNTNSIYTVNPRIALLIMLKYLVYVTGNPKLKLTKLFYNYVLNPDSDIIYEILYKLKEDGLTDVMFNQLVSLYPNANRYISGTRETCEYIKSSIDFYTACWYADANSSSISVSANIKHLLQLATIYGTYDLTDKPDGETIDELLLKEGIEIDVTMDYDVVGAIQALFKAAVLIDVDSQSEMDSSIELYMELLNKLTSYTVQTINSKTEEEKIFVYYNNTDVYRTYRGVIQAKDGLMVPYDTSYVPIKSYANSFVDAINSEIIDVEIPEIATAEWPIRGYMININTWLSQVDHMLAIEVHDYPVVDVDDLEFYNDFITQASGSLTPYDKGHTDINALHSSFNDIPTTNYAGPGVEQEDDNKYINIPNTIEGYGFVFNSNSGTTDQALIIEIEEAI